MKTIFRLSALLILGFIGLAIFIALMCLCESMPDILSWVSNYIGTTTTWVVFIGAITGFVAWCVAE